MGRRTNYRAGRPASGRRADSSRTGTGSPPDPARANHSTEPVRGSGRPPPAYPPGDGNGAGREPDASRGDPSDPVPFPDCDVDGAGVSIALGAGANRAGIASRHGRRTRPRRTPGRDNGNPKRRPYSANATASEHGTGPQSPLQPDRRPGPDIAANVGPDPLGRAGTDSLYHLGRRTTISQASAGRGRRHHANIKVGGRRRPLGGGRAPGTGDRRRISPGRALGRLGASGTLDPPGGASTGGTKRPSLGTAPTWHPRPLPGKYLHRPPHLDQGPPSAEGTG